MQKVTEEFLKLGIEKEINESQLILLDAKDKKDYKKSVLSKEISDARAELFVLLNGVDDKEIQDKVIKNYKALQKFRKNTLELDVVEIKPNVDKPTLDGSDLVIYCDGGCSPNPGKAGSGVAIYKDGEVRELWYGLYETDGTNNTAELNALYKSLEFAKDAIGSAKSINIRCDSMYSINSIKTWAISWERNGWKKKGGEIKNLEIIKKTYALYNEIKNDVELSYIKAHCGLEGNELADRMTAYARKMKNKDFVRYEKEIDVDAILKDL